MAQIQLHIKAPTDLDIVNGLESLKTDNKGGEFLARWTIEVDPDFIRNTLVPRITSWPRIEVSNKQSPHTTGHLLLEAMYYVVNAVALDPTLDKTKSLFKRSVHVEKKTPVLDRSLWHHRAAFNHYKLFLMDLMQKKDTVSTAEILKITKKIPYLFFIASILPDNAIKLFAYFAALERILRVASIEKSTETLTTIVSKAIEYDLLTDAQKQEYGKILDDPRRKKSVHWVAARTDTQPEKKEMITVLMKESFVPELRAFLKSLNLSDALKIIFDQNEAHFLALDGIYKELVDCYQKTNLKKQGLGYFHWMVGLLQSTPGLPIFNPEKSLDAFRAGAQLGDLRCKSEYVKAFADRLKTGVPINASLCQAAYEWTKDLMNCSLEFYTNTYLNAAEAEENPQDKLRIEWLDIVCDAAILHHGLLFAPPLISEDDKIQAMNRAIGILDHLSAEYGCLKSITFSMKHNLALAATGLTTPENVAQQFRIYASAARIVVQNPNAEVSLKREYIQDIKMFRAQYAAFIPDEANYHFGWILDPQYYQNFLLQLKSEQVVFTPENIEDYNGAIYLFLKDSFLDNRIPGVMQMKKNLVIAAAVKVGFKITENIDDLNQNKMISSYLYETLRVPLSQMSATLNVEKVLAMADILSYITPAALDVYGAVLSLKQQVFSSQLQLIAPLLEKAPDDEQLKIKAERLTQLVAENNKRVQGYEKMTKSSKKASSE